MKAKSVKSLAFRAGCDIVDLLELAADGHGEAAKEVHNLLYAAVSNFDEVCDARPDVFEPIARKAWVWPGLLSSQRDVKRSNEVRMNMLHLASEADLNITGKTWTIETPETKVALELYAMVKVQREAWLRRGETSRALERFKRRFKKRFPGFKRTAPPPGPSRELAAEFSLYDKTYSLARKLQPLSRKNYPQWFGAAWPTFLARYGKDFENRRCFAHLMPTAEKRAVKEAKKPRGVLRRMIKNAVRQGFKHIAPKVESICPQ
jgi:hypothetical protein